MNEMDGLKEKAQQVADMGSWILDNIRLAHGQLLGRPLGCDPYVKYLSRDAAIKDWEHGLEPHPCPFCQGYHLRPSIKLLEWERAVNLLKMEGKL